MSNVTVNRVNGSILAADITAINNNIAAITAKIPAGSLTPEERDSFPSLDVDNKVFVEDVITEIGINGAGIIPAFVNPQFIQNDLTLFEQLDVIEASLSSLLVKVSDVKRLAGMEAYGMSLVAYKLFDAANQAGLPGAKQAYDKLKARFKGGRPSDTADTPPTP